MTPTELRPTLTAWLDERAQPYAPHDLLAEAVTNTAAVRPRPSWRIPERWIPMPITLRLAVVPRAVLWLFLILFMVAC